MARLKDTSTSQPTGSASGGAKKSSSLMLVVIIAVVLILVGGTGLFLLVSSSKNQPAAGSQDRDMVVTPENVNDILAQVNQHNSDASYTTSMNVDWYFENGTSASSNSYIENPAKNSRTVYFDVLLKDTQELVYTSPYIPVGSRVEHIALQSNLSAGVYPAVCVYHLVDDDKNEVASVSVAVTLHIQN